MARNEIDLDQEIPWGSPSRRGPVVPQIDDDRRMMILGAEAIEGSNLLTAEQKVEFLYALIMTRPMEFGS
jgi:hypothetical protein